MATFANGYERRKLITIPASSVQGSTNFTDFPFLFNHTHVDYKDLANGGQVHFNTEIDIRFELPDGTKLNHSLERWNNITGQVIAWIKIPTLLATDDTKLYVYYGKDIVATEENPTSVWSSSYKGVWHMYQNPAGSAPQILDETSNANHGTSNGGQTLADAVDGKNGRAINFDGTNDYINVPNATSLQITGVMTMSYWQKLGSLGTARRNPIYKRYGGEFTITNETDGGISYFHGTAAADNVPYDYQNPFARINDNDWHYLTFVRSAGNVVKSYIDGKLVATKTLSMGASATTAPVQIGNGYAGFFSGVLDEVRLQNTDRSGDWVATEYDNQNDPDNFFWVDDDSNRYANGYQYRRLISTDQTKVSGGAPLTDFVMLFTTTQNDLKSVANGGKVVYASSLADIRFELADGGDRLYHQIDKYDPATGELWAWIRIPSLSNSASTKIHMYYGKTLDQTEESQYGTFNVRNASLVNHMSGIPDANSGTREHIDSSPMRMDGSSVGSMTSGQRVAGKIGYAIDFDGSNDAITHFGPTSTINAYGGEQNMTVSAWVNLDTITKSFQDIAENRNASFANWAFRIDWNGTTRSLNLVKYGVIDQNVTWSGAATGTWYYIVAVQGATSITYYVNGSSIGTFSNSQAFNATASVPLQLGGNEASTNQLDGRLDEVRVYKSQLTAAMIATEYANQNSPATFYTLGSEDAPNAPADATQGQALDSVTLTEHKTVAVADATHAHLLDTLGLTQLHNISVADLLHAQTIDPAGTLVEDYLMTVQDLLHSHILDEATIIDDGFPVPADMFHDHLLDSLTLFQRHTLTVADLTHAQTLDAIALTQFHDIVVNDMHHAHTVDPLTLTQAHLLAISDVLHANTLDSLALTQAHVIAPQDASHAHLLDAPFVYTQFDLIVPDLLHGHTVDTITILIKVKPTPVAAVIVTSRPGVNIVDGRPTAEIRTGAPISGKISTTQPRAAINRVNPINTKVKP